MYHAQGLVPLKRPRQAKHFCEIKFIQWKLLFVEIYTKNSKEPREAPFRIIADNSRFILVLFSGKDEVQLVFTPREMRKIFKRWIEFIFPE